MPKKSLSAEAWRTWATPTSRKQMIAFKDSCTEWIVTPPEETSDPILTATRYHTAPGRIASQPLTLSETRYLRSNCFFCESDEDTRLVMANPFAQRSIVAVCSRCM